MNRFTLPRELPEVESPVERDGLYALLVAALHPNPEIAERFGEAARELLKLAQRAERRPA